MAEVLIDQTTNAFQTNWGGGASYEGQLFTVPSGELWWVEEISVFGDGIGAGEDWNTYGAYCHIGICKHWTDLNPNNGFQYGWAVGCVDSGGSEKKHTWNMKATTNGLPNPQYPNGILCYPANMYYFYVRIADSGFSSAGGGNIRGSVGYAEHASCKAIDSSNSGGTWNIPASWVTDPNDLRFEMVGTKAGGGGGASFGASGNWSF